MTPHNTTWLALNVGEIHRFKGTFGVGDLVVVDIGIAERAAGDGVATDANGGNGANGIEDFVEKAFGDFGEEIAYVEGGGVEGVVVVVAVGGWWCS